MAELVQEAGGLPLIGDSPSGPVGNGPRVYHKSGMAKVAERTGARLAPFDGVLWKRLNGSDYFIARPVLESDLVINLPKLKTHSFTLFTGAVKNLFGDLPGNRKKEAHVRAPGVKDFSRILVDVLDLVKPGLTSMDGVIGQQGNGPGPGGDPRPYKCLLASADPVALDMAVTTAMSYRPGEVVHLAQAGARGLGTTDLNAVQIVGERRALDFGAVDVPQARWYLNVPSWASAPLNRAIRVRPQVEALACSGCDSCVEVCPRDAITPRRNWIARLVGVGN